MKLLGGRSGLWRLPKCFLVVTGIIIIIIPSIFFFFLFFFFQERHARWWAFPLVTRMSVFVVAVEQFQHKKKVSSMWERLKAVMGAQVDVLYKSRKTMWYLPPRGAVLHCVALCCCASAAGRLCTQGCYLNSGVGLKTAPCRCYGSLSQACAVLLYFFLFLLFFLKIFFISV